MNFNNSYGNFLNTFMSFKVWKESSVGVGVDPCVLFWIIFLQRGFFSLDCSRDILGFTCITAVLFNPESILQKLRSFFLIYITSHNRAPSLNIRKVRKAMQFHGVFCCLYGSSSSVVWVRNARYLIVQSHAKRELLNFFWHLGKESSFLGKKTGFVGENQESNGHIELELQHPFVENREGHVLSFWSEWSEDIYFELLVAVTQVNMLAMACRIKMKFYGENELNNSLNILMMPEWQKMVEFFCWKMRIW